MSFPSFFLVLCVSSFFYLEINAKTAPLVADPQDPLYLNVVKKCAADLSEDNEHLEVTNVTYNFTDLGFDTSITYKTVDKDGAAVKCVCKAASSETGVEFSNGCVPQEKPN